jgi:zinc/manganese transport system permease protein
VQWHQLWLPGAVGGLVAAIATRRPGWLSGGAFYLVFAVAVTASVQLVGVYLVFASLILPALAIAGPPEPRRALLAGLAVGALGYGSGLGVSALWDLPSGPTIVWTLAAAALTARPWLAAPRGAAR